MPCRLVLAAVLVLVACGAGPAQEPAPAVRIEAVEKQRVEATISYQIRTRDFTVTRWTVFLPEPPELPSQVKVKTAAEPAGKLVKEKSPLGRKVRLIDLPVAKPVAGAKLNLKLDIQATLLARNLLPLKEGEKPPAAAPLPAAERKYYLSPSPRIDFDAKPLQAWLDAKKLRRGKDEPTLALVARVLEVLRSDFSYRFAADDDRRASVACEQGKTDCGGFAFVFAAAMRANDVPARVLVGRLAHPRKPDAKPTDLEYDQPHVRAEVFVAGVGWVPVDPTYASTDKAKPVTAYVGHDPGDLLVLHVDLDLKLPFSDQDRTAELMQVGPFFWVNGRGTLDAALGPTGWELKATPLGEK